MKLHFLCIILVLLSNTLLSQISFPAKELSYITKQALENKPTIAEGSFNKQKSLNGYHGDFFSRVNHKMEKIEIPVNHSKSGDTLYVGLVSGDSLYVTGNFEQPGAIAVFGDGKLVFENANATIYGDLIIYGIDAKVQIINSTIIFPQSFYYERAIIAGLNGLLEVSGSTFDYYGLPHDLVLTDNATITWNNVTNIGFTTCGLSLNSEIIIDEANQAGEFILKDSASAHFSNATTVLVWHHIPDTGQMNISFPDGELLIDFDFDNTSPDLSNINYSYQIINCEDVMWGLMPEQGSSLTISDSQIRTIGVWFRDLSDYHVSGLVNNSYYSDFIAPLSSHSIRLVNTNVQTWSLYMFNNAFGEVNNCILGEIGTMENSTCLVQNSLIDGSGGYLFATDNSTTTSSFSYLNSHFQSSGNAFGIMAYGGQNMGRCIAFEKSIMIIIQANIPYDPEIYDDAMIWFLRIDGNSTFTINSDIEITGSAFMEHASDYYSHDVAWYIVNYSQGSSDVWIPVCDTVFGNEVFNGWLCNWNTEGLVSGNYTLKITMCDNTPEANKIEAVKQVNLLPFTGTDEVDYKLKNFAYPNPVAHNETLTIFLDNRIAAIKIIDETGRNAGLLKSNGKTIDLIPQRYGLFRGQFILEFFDENNHKISAQKIMIY